MAALGQFCLISKQGSGERSIRSSSRFEMLPPGLRCGRHQSKAVGLTAFFVPSWRDRGGELKDARGRVWSLIGIWTASFLELEAQSLFVTFKQISLLIGHFCDFVRRNNPGQIARIIRWCCITPALRDHAPMNPLIYMFLVEIFAVCQISMVDCNGR